MRLKRLAYSTLIHSPGSRLSLKSLGAGGTRVGHKEVLSTWWTFPGTTLVHQCLRHLQFKRPVRQLMTAALRKGEGDGTPLQYFCLENPMDGGAW